MFQEGVTGVTGTGTGGIDAVTMFTNPPRHRTLRPARREQATGAVHLGGIEMTRSEQLHQLREQLRWACDHDVLAETIAWLDARPPDKWETCDPARWGMSFYPTFDDVTDDEGDDTN